MLEFQPNVHQQSAMTARKQGTHTNNSLMQRVFLVEHAA